MQDNQLGSIAVVGGGVAGWMAAATLARLLKRDFCRIMVIERPAAPTPGIGEGTIPAFQRFNNLLGLDEGEFIRKTEATYKLGVEFRDWSRPGESYFHAFAAFGGVIASVPFHHYWLRLRALGDETPIADYSMASAAARLGRFCRPVEDSQSVLSLFSHAYHFDARLYTEFLRDYARARGVERIDRTVVDAELRSQDGHIARLVLDDGQRVEADFFIDCTGFPGLLMERVLHTGYEDWRRFLPCDRAVSIFRPPGERLPPTTRSTACAAGWQWSLPLRNGTDEGYVYGSDFIDDDAAAGALPVGFEPRFTRFLTGRPNKFWNRNCLALPGGFLEPLEATNIHLIQTGILKLFGAFPDRSFDPSDADEYNRLTAMEWERIRDFLILHYRLSARDDTPFWKHCRTLPIPDALRHKIALFHGSGRINMLDNEHFGEQSWLSLYFGHGVIPERYDPLADVPAVEDVRRRLGAMAAAIRHGVQAMPTHEQFLERIGQPVAAS